MASSILYPCKTPGGGVGVVGERGRHGDRGEEPEVEERGRRRRETSAERKKVRWEKMEEEEK